jgi:hypothetical protein
MKMIAVDEKLDISQAERLRRIVAMISDAMVDRYWGSLEFKFENGYPLPHVPARESRVLYERK